MEPAIVQTILTTWGPFGMVCLGGWYAIKWLAQRDDSRNAKLVQIVEDVSRVVANNTQAMQNMTSHSDAAVAQLARLERVLETALPKNKRK